MSLGNLFGHEKQENCNTTVIIDFSQIAHSTFWGQVKFDRTLNTLEDKFAFWKYLMLNTIRAIKTKYLPDELILAIDSSSWRKDEFKYYKARRILKRQEAGIQEFFKVINEFVEEMEIYFPFKVVKVYKAEADDIIGVLTEYLAKVRTKIIIASRDKDFKQLLKFNNVVLYSPIDKKELECKDPHFYLVEHVIGGDDGDDIPNVFSDDNTFVAEGKRQKPFSKKKKQDLVDMGLDKFVIEYNIIENYERNKKLIVLDSEHIPQDIQQDIKFQYENCNPIGDYIRVAQYLSKKKMRSLKNNVDQFLFR